MKREELSKYMYIGLIVLLIFVSFLVIRPYILPIISGFILAYLGKPLYDRMKRGLPPWLAATGCVLLIAIIILIPIASIVGGLVAQASNTIQSTTVQEYIDKLESLKLVQNLNLDVEGFIDRGMQFFITLLTNATTNIPSVLVAFFITAFAMYYILLDWEKIAKAVTKYLPVENKERLGKEIAKVTKDLVYGTLVIALLEFIVAMIGFYLAGVKYYLLLPALIAIFAFIPGLGPIAVWVPTALVLIAQEYWTSAFIITITGLILTVYLDTILRTKVSGKATNTHPLIVLIGIFGGISIFGIFGFVIGPLILSYTLKIVEEIATEMK